MNRPIENALRQGRAAKSRVRDLWVDAVKRHLANAVGRPLYLTLPGAEGIDVQRLIEENIIQTTETGAIAEEDRNKVIAFESNNDAIYQLTKKFPGLKIREQNLFETIGGTIYAWPNRERRPDFKASVINIDLDKPLKANHEHGAVSFPLVETIEKISSIQNDGSLGIKQAWTLCVTVNSSMQWPVEAFSFFIEYLADNCVNHQDFAAGLRNIIGTQSVERLVAERGALTIDVVEPTVLHRLLSIFLAKIVIDRTNGHQWELESAECMIYGGENGHAPMSSIILGFAPAPARLRSPARRYENNLAKVLPNFAWIQTDGTTQRYP